MTDDNAWVKPTIREWRVREELIRLNEQSKDVLDMARGLIAFFDAEGES